MSKHSTAVVSVKILPNTASTPAGKLADAEVVFEADAAPSTGSNWSVSPSGNDVAEGAT